MSLPTRMGPFMSSGLVTGTVIVRVYLSVDCLGECVSSSEGGK